MYKLGVDVRKKKLGKYTTVDRPELLRGEYAAKNHGNPDTYNAKDEYYTKKEMVEIFMNAFDKEQFKGKIVYSPADDDQSEFTKWFEEHKNELLIKEYIHTSDDFNSHLDIFEKADIVITNPPFSKITSELLPILLKTNCKYALFGNGMGISDYYNMDNSINCINKSFFNRLLVFDTPFDSKQFEGSNEKIINSVYFFSTLNLTAEAIEENRKSFIKRIKKKSINDIDLRCTLENEEYPAIDYVRNFPIDYDGYVIVPATILVYSYYFDFKTIRYKNIKFSDNQNRYKRVLAKKNNHSIWKELQCNN